jgi:hypothetical protein
LPEWLPILCASRTVQRIRSAEAYHPQKRRSMGKFAVLDCKYAGLRNEEDFEMKKTSK